MSSKRPEPLIKEDREALKEEYDNRAAWTTWLARHFRRAAARLKKRASSKNE